MPYSILSKDMVEFTHLPTAMEQFLLDGDVLTKEDVHALNRQSAEQLGPEDRAYLHELEDPEIALHYTVESAIFVSENGVCLGASC